jgi:hypothetical protein
MLILLELVLDCYATMDLYKLYKQFYQRSHRNPADNELAEMTQLARELAQKAYVGFLGPKLNADVYDEILDIATKLEDLEIDYWPKTIFSKNLVSAILKNNFCSNVPYERRHKWQETNNSKGYIYLFSANSRPDQVKIGATYLDPTFRSQKYVSKFGYSVFVESSVFVSNPFRAESLLAKALKNYRVRGNTFGDSNEWYYINIIDAKRIFKEFSEEYQNNQT